ncbi:MAG: hypothetical protein ACREK1_11290, partial [Longimicrobiales bacterium]
HNDAAASRIIAAANRVAASPRWRAAGIFVDSLGEGRRTPILLQPLGSTLAPARSHCSTMS